MKRNTLAIVVLLLAVQSCQSGGAPTAASTGAPEATTDTMLHADWEDPVIDATAPTTDPHTYAHPDEVRVTHVSLDLELDFGRKEARGTAQLSIERNDPERPLVLDADGLTIEAVEGPDGLGRGWALGEHRDGFGAPLIVRLKPGDEWVRIGYRTTPDSDAMQWLAPEQTAGGQPFLFTQGQAILTRTWIPLQDSPGIRVTYDAAIRCPEGLTPVMSAEVLERREDGAYRFQMTRSIPPYLIALACGGLEFRAISDRSGVWAEPVGVDAYRDELEDTEAMIRAAEALFGPYRWQRYDMIVLPPAFPYGGMENPRLTFLTPTMFAGDKSLVALIAHELAHSWSGNLVTNATWRDFWLNEGFTTYLENRIMEAVYGEERAEMELALETDGLIRDLEEMAPIDQVLHIDLEGRHPDDGFSGVPYTKGALFLKRMELLFGRGAFDEWLNDYFDGHAFQSITSGVFEAYLREGLLKAYPDKAAELDLRTWLTEPGLPDSAPRTESTALARVDRELERWRAGASADDLETAGWVTQQWLHFLEEQADELDEERMAALDAAFGFTEVGNNEVACVWLRIAVQHKYAPADARLESFLMSIGRRKFLQPLYTELAKTPEGKQRALGIYANARPRYHAVAAGTLDKILGVSS